MAVMNSALFCCLAVLFYFRVKAVQILRPYPKNIFAISGTEANSTCIFRDDGGPPVRARFMRKERFPGIKWFDIISTERVFQTNTTEGNIVTVTLHFKNITLQDDAERGLYECIATSATGAENRHGFNIKVTPREDLPVPRVISSQTASFGDNVRLYCNLTHKGNPSTTPITRMTFLKDGRPVKITPDVEDPLIFTDVRAKDGGNYTCRLLVLLNREVPYNVTGTSAATLRVRVRFAFTKSTVIGVVGDTVILVCSAQGYPMTVEWRKIDEEKNSGVVVKPDGRFALRGECDYCRSVLVITNATKEDSGNYWCSATESQGRQVFVVEVKTNSTSVASRTLAPQHVTAIFPFILWIWWL